MDSLTCHVTYQSSSNCMLYTICEVQILSQNFVYLPSVQPYFYMTKALLKSMTAASNIRLITIVNSIAPVGNPDLSKFNQGILWGYTKSLQNEATSLNCRCIDIGGFEAELRGSEMEQVFFEVWQSDNETQIAYRPDNARYVPRITSHKLPKTSLELANGRKRFQLVHPDTKSIHDLSFEPLEKQVLEDKDVEIQVTATGLNFKDILNIVKPSDTFQDMNAIGMDFAGVVTQIGENVSKWKVGDSVFGFRQSNKAFPSHVNISEELLLRVPDSMTLWDAATLPTVFITAYWCLIKVAKIKASDCVLIHTASGGVGLAAIQICQSVGCTIIATAGSHRKQNYLKTLGIQHVFHSRNTEFETEILSLTNGEGVDVVLNSLTGEGFKEATLRSCAKGAKFIEMSKISIWKEEEMKTIRPDVTYSIVDISVLNKTDLIHTLKQLCYNLKKNYLKPLPYTRFDGAIIREALFYLQEAKHIGKVVCIMPEYKMRHGEMTAYFPLFNEKSTYLITGGLNGIGFLLCKWMILHGAKHIVLVGRQLPTLERQREINEMNSEGANIIPYQLDVKDFDQCKLLIEHQIPDLALPQLRGVMHLAGILADGLIINHDWESLSLPFDSKIRGTLNLHELTKKLNLEHFVMFSSIVGNLGLPGQSNHAASCSFEDAISHHRKSIGLPAISLNYGQWAEVGVAMDAVLHGQKPHSNVQGFAALEYALKFPVTQLTAANIESFSILRKILPSFATYFDKQMQEEKESTPCISMSTFWDYYDSQGCDNEKVVLLQNYIQFFLCKILKLKETDIESSICFEDMGLDSLMRVELNNVLQSLFGSRINISVSFLRDNNTLALLASSISRLTINGGDELSKETSTSKSNVLELITKDCQLSPSITSGCREVTSLQDVSSVLITGCSGKLGPYILRELSQMPQIIQIICVMREKSGETCSQRLLKIVTEMGLLPEIDMTKLRCVVGNVAKPLLGMERQLWEELTGSVQAVFHCAAYVNHLESYKERNSNSDTRAVNIRGTQGVLEFSCTNRLKHVYFTSTMGAVFTADDEGRLSEGWQDVEHFDSRITSSYLISKFVGEILLKQAAELGIPCKVFRFPLITGDSKSGRFSIESNHFLLRYMFFMKIAKMPKEPYPVPMIPVDTSAKWSIKLFFNNNVPSSDVYNVANPTTDVDQKFISVADKFGFPVELVEFSEFVNEMMKTTVEDSPFALFKDAYSQDEGFNFGDFGSWPILEHWKLDRDDFFWSKKLADYLGKEYSENKLRTMDLIKNDLLFAKSQGWFEKYAGTKAQF